MAIEKTLSEFVTEAGRTLKNEKPISFILDSNEVFSDMKGVTISDYDPIIFDVKNNVIRHDGKMMYEDIVSSLQSDIANMQITVKSLSTMVAATKNTATKTRTTALATQATVIAMRNTVNQLVSDFGNLSSDMVELIQDALKLSSNTSNIYLTYTTSEGSTYLKLIDNMNYTDMVRTIFSEMSYDYTQNFIIKLYTRAEKILPYLSEANKIDEVYVGRYYSGTYEYIKYPIGNGPSLVYETPDGNLENLVYNMTFSIVDNLWYLEDTKVSKSDILKLENMFPYFLVLPDPCDKFGVDWFLSHWYTIYEKIYIDPNDLSKLYEELHNRFPELKVDTIPIISQEMYYNALPAPHFYWNEYKDYQSLYDMLQDFWERIQSLEQKEIYWETLD